MIVIDASAVLELLFGTPAGGGVRARLAREPDSICAPHLVDVEVAHVIRRLVHQRERTREQGAHAIHDLQDLAIRRYRHDLLLARVWELRDSLTAYDATYIALAEALDAPLLTGDRRLAKAKGHRARVEVI